MRCDNAISDAGAALVGAPLMFAAGMAATIVRALGVASIALSLRRGLIRERYGNWGRLIVQESLRRFCVAVPAHKNEVCVQGIRWCHALTVARAPC